MSSSATTSGTSSAITQKQDGDAPTTKKVPRYYNPYRPDKIVKGKCYASSVVSSQETMLENLRWTRKQLEKEEKALAKVQNDLYLHQYPNKWTNHRHVLEREDNDL